MNFNSNNTLLTSRVQQQQSSSSSSHPQQQPHIQNQAAGAQLSGNHQKAANMSNQASFPISAASATPSGMAKSNDEKIQQPASNLQQQHHSQNNNNNNNSHGGMNQQQQQILQHQMNVNRNMNVSNQQINKNLHQMSTPQQQQQQQQQMQQQQQVQNTFHPQQLMGSSLPKMGSILQQMSQLAPHPAQMTQGGPTMPPQHQQQFHTMQTQKFQSSSVLPPSLNQSKPLMSAQLQQAPVTQQMRQNYGNSPPLVSTTNQQQPMQYSSKPVHPQMKTTAKLASPGSQLQNFQQQLPSQLPLTTQQLPIQVTVAPPLPPSNVTITASGNNNVVSLPSPAKPILPAVSTAPITNSVPSSNTTTSSPSAPINTQPASATTPTKPFEKSPESTVKSTPAAPAPIIEKSSSVQVEVPLSSQKTNAKAPEEKKIVIEEKKAVENLIKTPEKPIIVTPQKVVPIISPVSKSTMRLATVTPPRKKPPPTITKKVTPQSNKKTVESPIKSLPVKADVVEKLPVKAAPAAPIEVPKTPKTPQQQKSTNVTPKTKRVRTKVQPYQSPTPELALVTKLSTQIASSSNNKNGDDKLTIFYKSEFLAVRNGEGTFYLCQAMHNVYKSSPKIKIRWLNEKTDGKLNEAGARTYNLDFYDLTDMECVLTTVDLDKVDSKTFELPKEERVRIESILKKAIDVEKGLLPRPSVTENNPDGLDLSIYKDEAQLDKLSSDRKRKSKKTSEDDDYSDDEPVKKKQAPESSPRKSLLPRASTRKPAIVDNESSSSESDEENLMEIKKKAKSQQAENNVKAEKSPTKVKEPVASTSKEVVKSARGRKRVSDQPPSASPEKSAKVLKVEEEIKPKVALKASPKAAKVLKKNEPSPKKETPIKDKKPEEESKLIESTTPAVVVSSKNAAVEKAQTTPPGNSKKKNQGNVTTSPPVVKQQEETPASKASSSRAPRNTRSKK